MIVDTDHKIYPSIARNHAPYIAVRSLVEEHDIPADDIDRIVVRGMQMPLVADFDPQSEVDAQFSLPHAVTMAALREPLGPDMYDQVRLFNPAVRAMLRRVELEHDVEADAVFFNEQRQPYSVRIDLNDGRSFSREIEFPRDQPRLHWPELEQKFRTLAATVLPEPQVDDAIAMIADLDRVKDCRALIRLLCPKIR